jgi:SAM-dependent methyltransferase
LKGRFEEGAAFWVNSSKYSSFLDSLDLQLRLSSFQLYLSKFMETSSEEYKKHLEDKYLPGRDKYLHWIFYPKLLRQFQEGEILDLGFGTGEFLKFLKLKKRECFGIDSNPYLTKLLQDQGFNVSLDDITTLSTVKMQISNAITDNVLEHLDEEQILQVFSVLKTKMKKGGVLLVLVPQEKGYKRDPTHKTFVDHNLISRMCKKFDLKLDKYFFHPVNLKAMGRFLYLNMQVFRIVF